MLKRRLPLAIALMVLVASSCSAGPEEGSASTPTPDEDTSAVSSNPDVEPNSDDCLLSIEGQELECGVLSVPQNWDDPEEQQIELPYVILKALDPEARQEDPILYLEGGPGPSPFNSIGFLAGLDDIRQNHDMIFLEYRGVGLASPTFGSLPECATAMTEPVKNDVARCWSALEETDINPSHYNTLNLARDAQALRLELGIDQWNVFGISYGSTVAQVLTDVDPDGVRSVVLDSPTSPSVELASADLESSLNFLSLVFERCASDASCNESYPGLQEQAFETLEALATEPWQHNSQILMDITGQETLTAEAFLNLVRSIPVEQIPAAIAVLAQLDGQALDQLANSLPPDSEPVSGLAVTGLPRPEDLFSTYLELSILCSEETAFEDLDIEIDTTDRWPDALVDQWMGQAQGRCSEWPVEKADPGDTDLVRNDLPTLIITGEFDNLTPKKQGEIVQAGLTNAVLVDVPTAGHAVVPQVPCAASIMVDFLAEPKLDVSQACLADLAASGPIDFFIE